jgi:electron transfer flavoprotein alpha/beta subunit
VVRVLAHYGIEASILHRVSKLEVSIEVRKRREYGIEYLHASLPAVYSIHLVG